jgi:hypothetical protein
MDAPNGSSDVLDDLLVEAAAGDGRGDPLARSPRPPGPEVALGEVVLAALEKPHGAPCYWIGSNLAVKWRSALGASTIRRPRRSAARDATQRTTSIT